MNKAQQIKKIVVGAGEYGCWECSLLPQTVDSGDTSQNLQPEKLWVTARSLKEIVNEIPGIESAVLLGKATCIADDQTPGIVEVSPDIQSAITAAARPSTPTAPQIVTNTTPTTSNVEIVKCPFCHASYPRSMFVHPEGIMGDQVLCPNPQCKMLSNPSRLQKV